MEKVEKKARRAKRVNFPKHLLIRVSDLQMVKIKAASSQAGVKVSAWMRSAFDQVLNEM